MIILSLTIMVQTMVKCSNKEVPIEKLIIDNKFSNIKINNIHSNKELKAQITTNKEVQTNSTKTKWYRVLNSNKDREVRVQGITIQDFKLLLSTIKDNRLMPRTLMGVQDQDRDSKEVLALSSVTTTTCTIDELELSNELDAIGWRGYKKG